MRSDFEQIKRQEENNIPELQFPFEQLREVDAEGKEWWNSRKLTRSGAHHVRSTLVMTDSQVLSLTTVWIVLLQVLQKRLFR